MEEKIATCPPQNRKGMEKKNKIQEGRRWPEENGGVHRNSVAF